MDQLRVTVFNEFLHERRDGACRRVYPDGIHAALASHLGSDRGLTVRTATLDEPEHGLSEDVLAATDVLLWWAHLAHARVADAVVDRVWRRVLEGMGFIALHSAHYSKPFRRLMGTGCGLTWREAGELERVWVVDPSHPIAAGLDPYFEIEAAETYGEFFDVPPPDELVFLSWFAGGEVFRSGATWRRGRGRVFYFRPGHETFPIYHTPAVIRVLTNAVHWAGAPGNRAVATVAGRAPQVAIPPNAATPKPDTGAAAPV